MARAATSSTLKIEKPRQTLDKITLLKKLHKIDGLKNGSEWEKAYGDRLPNCNADEDPLTYTSIIDRFHEATDLTVLLGQGWEMTSQQFVTARIRGPETQTDFKTMQGYVVNLRSESGEEKIVFSTKPWQHI